jgi:hypothetical protein
MQLIKEEKLKFIFRKVILGARASLIYRKQKTNQKKTAEN